MIDATESPAKPAGSPLAEAIVVVAVVQVLVLLLIADLMDGGVTFRGCTLALSVYWLLVAAGRLIVRGLPFRWFVAVSGWLPPAGCLAWVCRRLFA